jgi:hypothetical protein
VSGFEDAEAMREAAREVLRDLLPEMLRDALAGPELTTGRGPLVTNGHVPQLTNGQAHAPEEAGTVPQVPAPPVAAVLRPSTWAAPPAPGERIGDAAPAPGERIGDAAPAPALEASNGSPASGRVEAVRIDTDEDLQRFAQALAARMDNPRARRAVRTGQVRFALRRSAPNPGDGGAGAPVLRIEKGAVTERAVREAAASGTRLMLARGAVLTPLARDQARALGVQIDRESRC